MKVKITHPIKTDTDLMQAGRTVEVPAGQAEEWIAAGWAYEIHEHYGAQEEPALRNDDEIYERIKSRRKPRKDGEA